MQPPEVSFLVPLQVRNGVTLEHSPKTIHTKPHVCQILSQVHSQALRNVSLTSSNSKAGFVHLNAVFLLFPCHRDKAT